MKYLYIIRHAKSSWSDPDLSDHDRPLNERGEKDKVVMAKFINRHFRDIEAVYSSSAVRALDYAACIHRYSDIPLQVNERLYTFDTSQLLSCIHELPDKLNAVAVVTHNPAATEVINHLAELKADDKIVNLPTAAIVKLKFDRDRWSQLEPYSGHVVDFAKPKALDSFEDDLD